MRLDKYLADMGVGTRSTLKKLIRSGRVSSDGKVIRDPGFAVDEASRIICDGREITYQKLVYLMLNKPEGVISASRDPKQKTVVDLVETITRRDIFPVGRLDKDTEGLLLLTNDGELAHRLLSPKHHVDKTYLARLDQPVNEDMIRLFAGGLDIRDEDPFKALPAILESTGDGEEACQVRVTLQEGKFHQVKRMFHTVHREVLYLKRLSMGSLKLDEKLKPGEWRHLTDEEILKLKSI